MKMKTQLTNLWGTVKGVFRRQFIVMSTHIRKLESSENLLMHQHKNIALNLLTFISSQFSPPEILKIILILMFWRNREITIGCCE
jgi:hypothetical protein